MPFDDMPFDEMGAREMIVLLATWCEQLLMESSGYEAAIGVCFPGAREVFKSKVNELTSNRKFKELAAQRFAPCFVVATRGLTSADAQEMLDRAKRRYEIAKRVEVTRTWEM
jgi:hypothetical protein